MRARYYNPEIKRFVNQDVKVVGISDGQSINRYAYANGNPVSYLDPFGLSRDYDSMLDTFQTLLDLGGLIPVVGEPLDAINAVIYLSRGDKLNATLSGAAMIPILGDFATGSKFVSRGIKNLDHLEDAGELIFKGTSEASNAFKYDLLKKDLKYTEKYGFEARKQLPDGRIRYYGEVQPASKRAEMIGRRVVQELNPTNGNVRAWNETLDGAGRIRQVRPQLGPNKTHYTFDQFGNYVGKW